MIILMIYLVGLVLRLNYCLATPISMYSVPRQHDVGFFTPDAGEHASYIVWFYRNGLKLPPDPSLGQFYHPPLHHLIAAVWLHVFTLLGRDFDKAVSSLPFLTLFYSCMTLFVSEKLFDELGLKRSGKIAAFSLIAFHPAFFFLAGSLNNDNLSVLLSVIAVLAAVRWYRSPGVKNILFLALAIGLGMMTKLTCALIAPPVTLLFLIRLILFKDSRRELIREFFLFGAVCVPLGMWHPVWKYVFHGVPFNYILTFSTTTKQYIGFRSIRERLGDYSFDLVKDVYFAATAKVSDYFEYNPVIGLLKTSVFDEFNIAAGNTVIFLLSAALLAVNAVLIVLTAFSAVRILFLRKSPVPFPVRLFLALYQATLFVEFIVFCLSYPHACSMNFRYIAPSCVTGSALIALACSADPEAAPSPSGLKHIMTFIFYVAAAAFCILSAAVFSLFGG